MDYDLNNFNVYDNSTPGAIKDEVGAEDETAHDKKIMKESSRDKKIKKKASDDEKIKQETTDGNIIKNKASPRSNKIHSESNENEPKAKRARYQVKPELAQKVYEKMVSELVENYRIGLKNVPVDTLASAAGYKNSRSDAIEAAVTLAKQTGVFVKVKQVIQLTSQGIEQHVPKELPPANPTEALAKFWLQYERKLASGGQEQGRKSPYGRLVGLEPSQGW
uniref:Uncharacterized protein n=1 Tax=Amphora coffeiformis TaxID=265554 RepID=A0A7S3LDQ1_9STRA|mmetsp:Transcript_2284/g.4570  ORF Transcript_2284/g.4570 Transcript_2284/m.4570 type:complete len:221 (-) Transcript_2284:236-898(-)|eukprot:scaffold44770_cov214-Amphora_coffeaeformis.AAC.2